VKAGVMELENSFIKRQFDELTSLIWAFCTSRSLLSRQFLRDHPELLTDQADDLIGSAIEYFRAEGGSDGAIRGLERGRATLRVARLRGIDAAFADRLTAEGFDERSAQDVDDLVNCPTFPKLAELFDERPWLLTAEFEEELADIADDLRAGGHDEVASLVAARRYQVSRCRAGGIRVGLAQAHLVWRILGTAGLRQQYQMGDTELRRLMDAVAEFTKEGQPLAMRRDLIQSSPELLSPAAIKLMSMLRGYDLPDTALSALSTASYLAERALRDGLETACRLTALAGLYSPDVDDEMAVRMFDEYLNFAGEEAPSVIEPGDVEDFPLHWPSVRRRHLLLEEIRRTRPQRAWEAVMQFCAAYTPDQMRYLLETSPVLLSPVAEQVLARYRDAVAAESDAITVFLLGDRIQIMQRARTAGIGKALAESTERHLEYSFAAGEVTAEQIAGLRAKLEEEAAAGSASVLLDAAESASVLLDAADAASPAMIAAALLYENQPWAALHVLDQAISGTAEHSRQRAGLLLFKEGLLQQTAEHSPTLADVDDAIAALEEAGRCECPEADQVAITGNLGVLWHKRFRLTDRFTDLGRALALLKDAVRRTPQPPATAVQSDLLARRLTNLGLAQDSSLGHPLGGGDIGAVVATLEEAVRLTPDSCPPRVRVKRWSALATALMTRDGDGDAATAAQWYRQACELAEAAPDGQGLLPGMLLNLSTALADLAGTDHHGEPPAEALALLERACALAGDEQPGVALWSGLSWGRSASRAGDWENATCGYRYMLRAMRHLAGEQATRPGKETALLPAAGETSAAAYAIARAGHHAEAVEALEGARAVVASELLERDRTTLTP
jgi:tetratricopeptide (TPR) repeat protein